MGDFIRRNKNIRRPRKGAAERARRMKAHAKRLAALGVPEEKVSKLNAEQMRILLRRPAKLARKQD